MSETVSPGKAFRPVRTSYSTQPKDQMSVFRSRAWPRVCSVLGAFSGKRGGVRQIRGRFLLRDRLGETKIQQLHFSVGCDLDVRGFQVPMDDPFIMGGLEGLSDLPQDSVSENDPPRFPSGQASARPHPRGFGRPRPGSCWP